jgi:ABC-type polar amino acid transport system ATPase subunit
MQAERETFGIPSNASLFEAALRSQQPHIGCSSLNVASGKTLAGRRLAAYRSRIGMVFQHFELFPHMTALQNVIEGPVTVKRMDRRAAADLARGLLAKVGLAGKEQSYPAQLSGGQAQRVAKRLGRLAPCAVLVVK